MAPAGRYPILEAALDCVIVMDAAGRIVDFNPSAETTFGRQREEVVGRPLDEVIIPERLRAAHRAGLARYLSTGEGPVLGKRLELHAVRADGSEFPVELAVSPLQAASGERTFVAFLRDLTERDRVESQREAARLELAAAVARVGRLQSATAALAAARTLSEIANAALAVGVEALGATTGAFVREIDDASLGVLASVGVSDAVRAAFEVFPRDRVTPSATVFRTGQPEWIESEAEFEQRYSGIRPVLAFATGAVAALPLTVDGKVVASVAFRFIEPRAFTEADRAMLQTFAVQAGHALERVLAFEREVAARGRLEALADLTSRLAMALSEDDVAKAVIERGMSAMSADTCTLYRLASDGALVLVAERGCSPAVVAAIRRIDPTSADPTTESVRARRSLWVETEAEYHALFPSIGSIRGQGPRARAFWSVPLVVEGHAIGLLAMGFYAPRRFSPEERGFIETFAQSAAQALRRAQRLESESRARRALATTLRSIGDAVIATDTTGAITFLNPVAEQLTGWTAADALGTPVAQVFRIINETTRKPVESPVDRVIRDNVVVGLANHTVLLTKDGREVPIDDSGAPIRGDDEAMTGVVLVFRDVTTKKREAHRRAFLADATSTLASSLDYEATLSRVATLVVPMFADWCGIDVVEPGGGLRQVAVAHVDPTKVEMARALGERYPPDPNATTGVPNVLRTGVAELYPDVPDELLRQAAVDEDHLTILRTLQFRSAMVVPLTARGQVLGAITFVHAESGRSYAAEDLQFAEDLARRAAVAIDNSRLYAAEQRARNAADLANNVKDEFLATVSHELRTPLNAIMGWAKMLLVGPHDPDRLLRAATTIERNSAAMARLIDDLLDISSIVAGKLRLEPQRVDLAGVVNAAVESARPIAAAKDIEILTALDSPAMAQVDPARLEQVVWNLLSNAVKFSQKGGRVEVTLRTKEHGCEIVIRDEGKGVEPAFLPHVFDPFVQADGKITRAHGGLGLGLAIARQLVELHGGRIEASSEGEGKGSTFVVRLPLEQTAHPNGGREPAPEAGSAKTSELRGLRVLVVDDDDDARELVQAILEADGCVVRTASSAAEAMDQLRAELPDVMVSDIGMPGEDGCGLIRRVRNLPVPQGALPAIALTAYTRAEERRRALEAGFNVHLPKPLDPATLVSVIASVTRSTPSRE